MNTTKEPAQLATNRHTLIEGMDNMEIRTEVIKEWVVAVEGNRTVRDINAGVTLNCIRCQQFDAYRVYDCKADGCPLWPFRLKALMLDEESKKE